LPQKNAKIAKTNNLSSCLCVLCPALTEDKGILTQRRKGAKPQRVSSVFATLRLCDFALKGLLSVSSGKSVVHCLWLRLAALCPFAAKTLLELRKLWIGRKKAQKAHKQHSNSALFALFGR
jgi:hypothetical protein